MAQRRAPSGRTHVPPDRATARSAPSLGLLQPVPPLGAVQSRLEVLPLPKWRREDPLGRIKVAEGFEKRSKVVKEVGSYLQS